jgi:thiol-disulfide isomerase/thioredoxin
MRKKWPSCGNVHSGEVIKFMKKTKILLMAFLILSVHLMGCASVSVKARDLVDRSAPAARITMLDGQDRALSEFQGKHLFLLFWTTWCSGSRPAIKEFEELALRYKRHHSFQFLAVSLDKADNLESLKSRIKSDQLDHIIHGFSGNDIYDEAFMALHGDLLPYAVVIDPRGVVKSVSTSVASIEDYIDDLLQ